jgi:hypothetical protein
MGSWKASPLSDFQIADARYKKGKRRRGKKGKDASMLLFLSPFPVFFSLFSSLTTSSTIP